MDGSNVDSSNSSNLIQCYKQFQSDIVLGMKNMQASISHMQTSILNSIHESNKALTANIDLTNENMQLRDKIRDLMCLLSDKDTLINELNEKSKHLKEENESFRKVSQIIAFENENARLKKELEVLKKRNENMSLVGGRVSQPAISLEHLDLDILHNNLDKHNSKEPEPASEETADLDVFEKKIKGVTYYVSNDDEKRVFEKLDDGSIGNEIGKLQMAGSKYKLVSCQT